MSRNQLDKRIPQVSGRTHLLLALLGFLLPLSLGANAYLFWGGQRQDDINISIEKIKNQYKFLDPAQGFYRQKDLIVDIQPLRDELNEIGKNKNISIYFEYLPTGANIAINKDIALWPASLMKIPVAMAVMKKIEKGEWKLENELVLFNDDKDSRFGELYKKPVGSRFTIRELLDEMLINSDNTSRSIFMRNLDASEITEVLEHLGIEDVFNKDREVTTKKFSIFWRSLFAASYLSPEHSQKLLEIMNQSSSVDYLRQGIPENIPLSHKIGVSDDVYSDSGIVYAPNRPFIITVMMREKDESKVKESMKLIIEKSYNYVANY